MNIWEGIEYAKKHSPEYLDAKFEDLVSSIHAHRQQKVKRLILTVSSSAAVIFFALFTYFSYNSSNVAITECETIAFNIIETRVETPKDDVTIKVGNEFVKIIKNNIIVLSTDSTVNIQSEKGENIKLVEKFEILEVNVPNGHQFSMTLPDSTKVWFNSGSKMRYPSSFDKNIRRVEIEGEVYFDVKRNEDAPFIVSVNNKYDIEVLGTEFNVKSYVNDKVSSTTLVDGKVAIHLTETGDDITLSPSEQSVVSEDNIVNLRRVNTENFTSWREQRFVFNNESLEEIALEMARCYDIEIDVAEKYKNHRFTGRLNYNKGIDYFIKVLKDIKNINSTLKDNKLSIGI